MTVTTSNRITLGLVVFPTPIKMHSAPSLTYETKPFSGKLIKKAVFSNAEGSRAMKL